MYENYTQGQTARLTRQLRGQLQEMTAAVQVLSSAVRGNAKAEEYLAVLNRDICGQLHLLRQLELNERLYSLDEIRLRHSLVDLVELCRRLTQKVDDLSRPFLEIRAEFATDLTALPTMADGGALEQMLLGFFSNSVRAVGRSGFIRLELAQVEDRAVFTMTDSGGGMDSEALAGLFDPDGEAETPARGLLLARQVAELHGGTLMAGNGESGGACVAVSIPIVERVGGVAVHSPGIPVDESGGWNPALVALWESLPAKAFLPEGPGR